MARTCTRPCVGACVRPAEFLYDNWPANETNATERKVWPRLYLWTKDTKLHVDVY